MATKKRDASEEDVVLLGPPLESGVGRHVLRKRGERIEHGAVRPMEEGKPIHGEVVTLRAREEPGLFDVHVEHEAPQLPRPESERTGPERTGPARTGPERTGPAQVATEDYRRGWNRLFSRASKKHGAN